MILKQGLHHDYNGNKNFGQFEDGAHTADKFPWIMLHKYLTQKEKRSLKFNEDYQGNYKIMMNEYGITGDGVLFGKELFYKQPPFPLTGVNSILFNGSDKMVNDFQENRNTVTCGLDAWKLRVNTKSNTVVASTSTEVSSGM